MKALLIGVTVGCAVGVLVTGVFLDRPQAVAAQAQQLEAIPGPESWVALSADVVRTFTGDAQRQLGRFYQGSDGSTRLDLWGEGREDDRVVRNIKNVSQNTYYHYFWGHGQWYSHPMQLPPDGFTPGRRLQSNYVALPAQIQGFDVYRRITSSGMVEYAAPALNFLVLVSQHTTGSAARQELTNIVLGEPERSVFTPPAAALIEASSEVSGIVYTLPGDPPPPPDVH